MLRRGGYLEGIAAISRTLGPQATLEAGWRLGEHWGLYGRAYLQPDDAGAGVGLRAEW